MENEKSYSFTTGELYAYLGAVDLLSTNAEHKNKEIQSVVKLISDVETIFGEDKVVYVTDEKVNEFIENHPEYVDEIGFLSFYWGEDLFWVHKLIQ